MILCFFDLPRFSLLISQHKESKIAFDTHEKQYVIFVLRSQCVFDFFFKSNIIFFQWVFLFYTIFHLWIFSHFIMFCLLIRFSQANVPNVWLWVVFCSLSLSNFNFLFVLNEVQMIRNNDWWTDEQNNAERMRTHSDPPTVKHQLKIACETFLWFGLKSVYMPLDIVPYGKSSSLFQWLFLYGFVRRTLSPFRCSVSLSITCYPSAHAAYHLNILTSCLLASPHSLTRSHMFVLSQFCSHWLCVM